MRIHTGVWTIVAAAVVCALVAPVGSQTMVKGSYRANGQEAKLAYVLATKAEAFAGKEAVTLILTEKDPSKQKNPEITASFGDLGSALIVGISKDGGIHSCQVAHTALKRMGANSIGKLKVEGLQWSGGTVKGRLTTGGPVDLFDEKWEVDVTFEAKIR
jgi:hypothetical protein